MSSAPQESVERRYDDSNDDNIIAQAKNGDVAAFEMLYRRYYDRICVYLVHLVTRNDIGCELTQETFIKAWRTLPSLRDTRKFPGWLYRIATNLAYDYKRHTKHEHVNYYNSSADIEEYSVPGPEEQIEIKELLKAAISQVTWKYRVCLILYHFEGFSKQQIADCLRIKPSSVGTYICYGLEQLRKNYRRLSR